MRTSNGTLSLYHTLFRLLGKYSWRDIRHCKTLLWMMVGLISTGTISLNAWADCIHSRASYAQSTIRRFRRWLANKHIQVHELYGPIIQETLQAWTEHILYLALDTSRLPDGYCLIRVSIIYRGRAVPLVWQVLAHNSSSVAFETVQPLLKTAAALLPSGVKVVLLADRGFADTELMKYLRDELVWHYRIRLKGNMWVYRGGRGRIKLSRISLAVGEAQFWQDVQLTEQKRFGPVYLALGQPLGSKEKWLIASDEPGSLETFSEYALRFDIEEGFLDEKSNGFQLEDTRLSDAEVLTRLCLVLALCTLYLVLQGVEVVKKGRRRAVDAHWFRGSSYLKLGWRHVRRMLAGVAGYELVRELRLTGEPDPEPAMASRRQHAKRRKYLFTMLSHDDAATFALAA
jgi:hypothetical protein